MMTQCSQQQGEAHLCRKSTNTREPPIEASVPPLDERVINQGSLDEWDNLMGIKQLTTLQVAFHFFSNNKIEHSTKITVRFYGK